MESEKWPRPEMVDWYEPLQLLDTGLRTLVSMVLGNRLDTRLLSAAGTAEDSTFDYSDRTGFRFDWAADTGDGWDGTFTLAYLLSSPSVPAAGGAARRCDCLVLGGDEVYPVASREAYARRLVWPFNQAARKLGIHGRREELRDVFLIPGNHDWYDSLASFNRRFLNQRWLGAFRTRQRRSYCALKLPHHWHLWATDIQLGKDIDVTQFRFFSNYAEGLTSEDRIILCSAEPTVVYGTKASEQLRYTLNNLQWLAERQGARVPIKIAGDVHNYQRYVGQHTPRGPSGPGEPYEQVQVVSGGGGAFLHPTHAFETDPEEGGGYRCLARYPSEKVSSRLSWRNLAFAVRHPGMSVLLGLVFLATFWSLPPEVSWLRFPLEHPFSFLLMLATVAGFVAFSGTSKPRTTVAGIVHGLAQVGVGLVSWQLGTRIGAWLVALLGEGGGWRDALALYLPKALLFAIAAPLAGTLFGVYLLVSLNFLRNHHNEAFSSLACADWKSFLRCEIRDDGALYVKVVGIPKVASDDASHPVATEIVETFSVR